MDNFCWIQVKLKVRGPEAGAGTKRRCLVEESGADGFKRTVKFQDKLLLNEIALLDDFRSANTEGSDKDGSPNELIVGGGGENDGDILTMTDVSLTAWNLLPWKMVE